MNHYKVDVLIIISKKIPVTETEVFTLIEQATELVPDAFNMKSSRVVTVTGKMQDTLWDSIYNAFEGKVAKEKLTAFRKDTELSFISTNRKW